jgi:polyisoprenoid-binding protein YceI
MNRLPAGWLALALFASLAPAPRAAGQTLDLAKSQIGFVSIQMGVPVAGQFRKFQGTIQFDPKKPEASKAEFSVDIASIDAGSPDANTEVQDRAWFDTPKFPNARFSSSAIKSLGGGRYEVRGKLSLKGLSREVVALAMHKTEAGGGASFSGGFVLKRLDFSIGDGIWSDSETVANEVEVKFHLVFTAKPK